MNMQALMRQAQAMQKDIARIKSEIDNTEFEGTSGFITVKVNGKKEILKVSISEEAKDLIDDLSMLEDMIMLATNLAFKNVDSMTENKMGKYSKMMQGLL